MEEKIIPIKRMIDEIDVAELECPKCKQILKLIHLESREHKLRTKHKLIPVLTE